MLDRKTYRLTLERQDGTWAQYIFHAENMDGALRYAARSFDVGSSNNVTIIEVEE